MVSAARASRHVPVLLAEVLEAIAPAAKGAVLDCTLGGGGHTRAMLEAFPEVTVAACDRDARAIERAQSWAPQFGKRLTLHHCSFSDLEQTFSERTFSGVLADLGMSTDQLWENRGFSFSDENALDMRMDERLPQTAQDLLNTLSEPELNKLFAEGGVGQERHAIVKAIVRARPLAGAKNVALLVEQSFPAKFRKGGGSHPATVVFQALRIAVNREREEISALMHSLPQLIHKGGRAVVIAFHSLEDGLVAREMRQWASRGEFSALNPGAAASRPSRGNLLTKKATQPGQDEVARNPASRSALLRVFEFLEK